MNTKRSEETWPGLKVIRRHNVSQFDCPSGSRANDYKYGGQLEEPHHKALEEFIYGNSYVTADSAVPTEISFDSKGEQDDDEVTLDSYFFDYDQEYNRAKTFATRKRDFITRVRNCFGFPRRKLAKRRQTSVIVRELLS